MAKNDFDIDFDFEKEYGFDPKSILDSDYTAEDLDFSQFDSDQLALDLDTQEGGIGFEDFDLEELGLSEAGELPQEESPAAQEPEEEDFAQEPYTEEEAVLDRTRRLNFFQTEAPREEPTFEEALFAEETFDDALFAEDGLGEEADLEAPAEDFSMEAAPQELPLCEPQEEDPDEDYLTQEEDGLGEEELDEDDDEDYPEAREPAAAPHPRRRERKKQTGFTMPKITLPAFTMPPIFTKLYKLYFPSMEEVDPKPQPGSRRRRKTKLQVFKEAYLPAILACVTLVLIFSFMIGSLSNAIAAKREQDEAAKLQAQQASQEADRAAAEAQSLIAEAKRMAAGYNYAGAIKLLEGFTGDASKYPEMTQLKSEYLSAQNGLVEWKDLSTVPNLSFHVLIHDLTRALADEDNGGMFNRNFVTTEEFSKILDQLYKNGYVLVDMDCFVKSNTGSDGTTSYFVDSVLLPQGKKPVMITETMVNYFAYMIDGDNNGTPDAGGSGFASKLVVDSQGNIKAEYVDTNGQTQQGSYDLVPILEDFIKAHPDFCYQDSRATLAVCGYEGVFGYRINNTYVSTMGQSYVDDQIAQAKNLVSALRAKGYTIACYTYGNKNYADLSAQNIQADMASWTSQIVPVLGQVDTLVFARESDIGDYSGPKFTTLYQSGIRYFIKSGTDPYAEVNPTFVRQTRLMVTGNTMAWKGSMFTDDGLFDPVTVLSPARGNVPN